MLIEIEQLDRLGPGERLATALAVGAYFVVGYFSVQLLPALGPVREPMTGLDRLIPFAPGWVWAYVWAIPAAVAPAFVVRSRTLFQRTAAAYLVAITASLALFIALPASAITLRPSSAALDLADPSEWLVANFYAIDPPGNLFPSLHLSMTTLSAWAVWKADRRLGCVAFVGLPLVAASACAVKQHFVADVAGGLGLAVLVGAPTIGRCRAEQGDALGCVSRGVVIYVLLALVFYAAITGAYAAGLRIHRCPDVTGVCLATGPREAVLA